MPDGVVHATSDSMFVRDVLATGRPTLVYYSAPGCIPCLFAHPHVERLARRYRGRVTFVEMNMGWSAARVERHDISAWPALTFSVGNTRLERQVGVDRENLDDSLTAFVERGLARAAHLPEDGAAPLLKEWDEPASR